jgi:tetratricopeptide (TPR) repeat protein
MVTKDENPLRIASAFAREGRLDDAIACLESALAGTRSEDLRPANTSLVAKTAAVLCEQDGRLLKAANYYDEAIASGDTEPLVFVALADVQHRLGRANEAEACLARAEALAKPAGDSDTMTAVANARVRWAGGGGS